MGRVERGVRNPWLCRPATLLSLSWTRWAEWFCAAAHRCEAIVRRLLLKEAKSSLGEAEWGEPDLEAYTQFCSAAEEARRTTS